MVHIEGVQRPTCQLTWTTGTGPNDKNDTGIHHCAIVGLDHLVPHECLCGARKPINMEEL